MQWADTRPEDNTPATAVAGGHFVQVALRLGIWRTEPRGEITPVTRRSSKHWTRSVRTVGNPYRGQIGRTRKVALPVWTRHRPGTCRGSIRRQLKPNKSRSEATPKRAVFRLLPPLKSDSDDAQHGATGHWPRHNRQVAHIEPQRCVWKVREGFPETPRGLHF